METKLLQALGAHYTSRIQKAEANLLVYFKHPRGVGEHSDIVGEMTKMVDEIGHCRGCLDALNALAKPAEEQEPVQTPDQ